MDCDFTVSSSFSLSYYTDPFFLELRYRSNPVAPNLMMYLEVYCNCVALTWMGVLLCNVITAEVLY